LPVYRAKRAAIANKEKTKIFALTDISMRDPLRKDLPY
jgi:hypothetical protein